MNLTKDERLALLVAAEKQIKPALSEAKDEARANLLEEFANSGSDRKAILVDGVKVGEVGISYSKGKPEILIDHQVMALAWLKEHGLVEVKPAKGWEEHFSKAGNKVVHSETGEVIEWAIWNQGGATTASVRGCKPEDVINAFGNRLAGMNILELGDSNE